MATTIDVVRDRVASICASAPFAFGEAVSPFDFDRQPTTAIDQIFRITSEPSQVIGGFNYSEERFDILAVWVARKQASDPNGMYRTLLTDASSIRAAVIRDGTNGDYSVPNDGAGFSINHDAGAEFAVLRVLVPVVYEATV